MLDSRPSSADEKATVVESKPKRGFFTRRQHDKPSSDPEKHQEPTPEVKVEDVPPVGFLQLFRCVPLNDSSTLLLYANLFRLVSPPSLKSQPIL